jgi:glucose/mannose-6-phosphate isomerase
MTALDRESIEALDSGNVLADALGMAHQLGDALWRAQSAGVPRTEAPHGVVFCGMGGSAIGADLAIAAIGDRASAPLVTVRGYEPPSWTGPGSLVVASSYSGTTEETLSCFRKAGEAGAARVAVTTGGELAEAARADGVPVIGVPSGFQPRSAVAYGLVPALVCAELAGAAPPLAGEVEAAQSLLGALAEEWGPESGPGSPAKALAGVIGQAIPVVYGAGATAPVARRWKTQINEMAKRSASWGEIPESDHNEICGFAGAPFHTIFLSDPAGDARLQRRLELTAEVAAQDGLPVDLAEARGESPLERVLSLVLLGDLVSIYLAALGGVDPTPVEPIDRFKRALG